MVTREQLAALLQSVPVTALSEASGVSEKTIYRLRHQANAPRLDTAHALIDAIKRIKPRGRRQQVAA